jgi:hypothetical protein
MDCLAPGRDCEKRRASVDSRETKFEDEETMAAKVSRSEKSAEEREFVEVLVNLTCRNIAKSPAFIEGIYSRAGFFSGSPHDVRPAKSDLERVEPLGLIIPGDEKSTPVYLTCEAKWKDKHFISAYLLIEYRAIFRCSRQTISRMPLQKVRACINNSHPNEIQPRRDH